MADLFRLAEILVAEAGDLVLDARAQRHEQEAELDVDLDLLLAHLDVTRDAHALEAQGVAIPFMVEAELLAEFLGDVLGALARLLQRRVVGPDDPYFAQPP